MRRGGGALLAACLLACPLRAQLTPQLIPVGHADRTTELLATATDDEINSACVELLAPAGPQSAEGGRTMARCRSEDHPGFLGWECQGHCLGDPLDFNSCNKVRLVLAAAAALTCRCPPRGGRAGQRLSFFSMGRHEGCVADVKAQLTAKRDRIISLFVDNHLFDIVYQLLSSRC